jgi:phosphopantothenoylcysteine decarboxylase/phosphopantothenate--cysteine ligase
VRTITNRSSGKQGFALAQAALDYGAQVVLIPAAAAAHWCPAHRCGTPEMLEAVIAEVPGSSALVMAAAVAVSLDLPAAQKIKKKRLPRSPEPTLDMLNRLFQARGEAAGGLCRRKPIFARMPTSSGQAS